MTTPANTSSKAILLRGLRAVLPLTVGAVPFGLIYGLTVSQSIVGNSVGIFASFAMFSGAAQLTLVELIDGGSTWYIVVGTALVINSRMGLYSAALAPVFREQPGKWKYILAAFITDQTAAIGLAEFERETDPRVRRLFYMGASVPFLAIWFTSSAAGVLFGDVIPEQLDLGFAVPLMFIAMAIPSLKNRPAVLAASVAIAVTLATSSLPNGTNIVCGAIAGIAVGAWSDR